MLKKIGINSYMNGYNYGQINCIDIPIAGAAGFFNYDNYFFYSFYRSTFSNWGDMNSKDFLEYSNEILTKLGLKMKAHEIKDDSELIPFIKTSIDNSYPLIFIADYTSLFYSYDFLFGNPSVHGIIISGYDSSKQIVAFNETNTVDPRLHPESNNYFNGNPLFIMLLKEEQVKEIWNNRNKYFEKNAKGMVNIIWSIQKDKEPEIKSYEEMVSNFLNLYHNKLENDNLIRFVNDFNNNRAKIKNEAIMWNFQRDLYGSLEAFFGGIEMGIKSTGFKGELNDFNVFKEQYRNKRAQIIAKLYADALRGKDINKEMKEEIIAEIEIRNRELVDFVKYWYEIIKQGQLEHNTACLVNYAFGVQAWADSEFKNGAVHCKASQAVDGKWSDWQNDLWSSDNLEEAHWLKIDLIESRTIIKFVIRHDGVKNFVTVDFEIQGSNDDMNWEVLVSVQGNKEHITTHEVMPCSYRYFKLNIIKPGQVDNYARIYEFEAWGMKIENE